MRKNILIAIVLIAFSVLFTNQAFVSASSRISTDIQTDGTLYVGTSSPSDLESSVYISGAQDELPGQIE